MEKEPITIEGLKLYDKELNQIWGKKGYSNTPLGLIHDVNFKILKVDLKPDEKYKKLIDEKQISQSNILEMMQKYNNVIKEMKILWSVIKN